MGIGKDGGSGGKPEIGIENVEGSAFGGIEQNFPLNHMNSAEGNLSVFGGPGSGFADLTGNVINPTAEIVVISHNQTP